VGWSSLVVRWVYNLEVVGLNFVFVIIMMF